MKITAVTKIIFSASLIIAMLTACAKSDDKKNSDVPVVKSTEELLNGYWQISKVAADADSAIASLTVLKFNSAASISSMLEFCGKSSSEDATQEIRQGSSFEVKDDILKFYLIKHGSNPMDVLNHMEITVKITELSEDELSLDNKMTFTRFHPSKELSVMDETGSLCKQDAK